jgi:SAM-dependent methyltransferase
MNETTIRRLNAINRRFYAQVADDFDITRASAWPGWSRLLLHLRPFQDQGTIRVLDVGCGNGRFGVFLAGQFPGKIHYHGLDNSPALLDRAQRSLSAIAGDHFGFGLTVRDLIESPPADDAPLSRDTYDLVALFGVMHHIPGSENRRALMRALAAQADQGGLLAVAFWRFMDFERFRERVVPWPDDLAAEVEYGDHLLNWRGGSSTPGESPLRYCHHVDDAEQIALVEASGLQVVEAFRADGFTGTVNSYRVLRRK